MPQNRSHIGYSLFPGVTKLSENTIANLHIPGYLFVRSDSNTHAGGVGLYICDQLVFSRRRDFGISCGEVESC